MTPKEIVLRATRFEKTPRTPVAVIDGYLWMIKKHQLSFKKLFELPDSDAVSLILDTYEQMQSDIVYGNAAAIHALREVMGGASNYSTVGGMVETTKPSVKALTEIRSFTPDEVFSRLIVHPYYQTMARQLELLAARAGSEKLVMAFTPGPLTLAASFGGVEPLLMALYEDPELVQEVLEFSTQMNILMLQYQAQHGASAISIADPVSSVNVISAECFEAFSLPYIQKVTAAIKELNMPIMLHICGDTTARLEPVKKAGIDIFSVDSIDLENALETAHGHYAVFGTLSPFDVLQQTSEDNVYALSAKLCETAGTAGGFILAPGCDLTPDTPLENIQAMARAAYNTTA